jgi:hypothetical protein
MTCVSGHPSGIKMITGPNTAGCAWWLSETPLQRRVMALRPLRNRAGGRGGTLGSVIDPEIPRAQGVPSGFDPERRGVTFRITRAPVTIPPSMPCIYIHRTHVDHFLPLTRLHLSL